MESSEEEDDDHQFSMGFGNERKSPTSSPSENRKRRRMVTQPTVVQVGFGSKRKKN